MGAYSAPDLPVDVLMRIFEFLANCSMLSGAAQACPLWHSVSLHGALWRRISLQGRQFRPDLLRHLRDVFGVAPAVYALDLYRCHIGAGDLLTLLEHCGPSLVTLTLGHEGEGGYELSAAVLNECLQLCPGLQHLTLIQAPRASVASRRIWDQVHAPPLLRTVRLCNMGFGSDACDFLAQLPHLQRLAIHEAPDGQFAVPGVHITKSAWSALIRRCPNLMSLEISGVGCGSTLLMAPLHFCHRLRSLWLHNVSPSSLRHLQSLQPGFLTSFLCGETVLPSAAVATLFRCAPRLQVLVVEMLADLPDLSVLLAALPLPMTTLVLGQVHLDTPDAQEPPDLPAAVALLLGHRSLRYWELLRWHWYLGGASRPIYVQPASGCWSRWQRARTAEGHPRAPDGSPLNPNPEVQALLRSSSGVWGWRERFLPPLSDPESVQIAGNPTPAPVGGGV